MMFNKSLFFIPAVLCAGILCQLFQPIQLKAQFSLPQGDSYEYYYRVMQISGIVDDRASFQLRPFKPEYSIQSLHPWAGIMAHTAGADRNSSPDYELHFYEPVWFQSYNTSLPRGGQDGAVWQGKGYNTAFSTGFYASYGPLHLSFRPQIGIAQNQAFNLGPYNPPDVRNYYVSRSPASEYAYRDFGGRIDTPVRFGPDSYSWFSLGDSSLELRYFNISAGISNQRLWTGPGVHNSLQFGFNAPGFLHMRVGTYKPLRTQIGDFEFMYIFGGVRKSDYFHEDVRALHSVNSMSLVYSPGFAKGLSLGAIRTFFHRYPADFTEYQNQFKKIFEAAVRVGLQDDEDPTGHDPDNQIASVFARWFFPDAGFELYFEYARNDHNIDLRDFRMQPNHHRAYLLGMQKSYPLSGNRLLAVGMEVMQSETPRNSLLRGNQHLGGWYVHSQQVVGFTNRGQIMGTAFGPGANVQMITADLFEQRGRAGITLARIVHHNSRIDQYFQQIQAANSRDVEPWEVRNVELMAGLRGTFFLLYDLELEASIEQSWIFNHHNLAGNDLFNTRFEITLRKQLDGWLR